MCRLAVLVSLLLVPSLASADLNLRSAHRLDLTIDGDPTPYTFVETGVPLEFSIEGPAKVFLKLRQDIPAKARGYATKVVLFQDGMKIRTVLLEEGRESRYIGVKGSRPSKAVELQLNVPQGPHRFELRSVTRRRRIAVGIGFQWKEGAAMVLAPLVAPDADSIPLAGLGATPPGPEPKDEPPAAADKPSDIPLLALAPLVAPRTPETSEPAAPTAPPFVTARPAGPVAWEDQDLLDDTPERVSAPMSAPERAPVGFVAPPLVSAAAGDGDPFDIVVGLRGVIATRGIGSGPLGGGVHVLVRPAFLGRSFAFGVAAGLLPFGYRVQAVGGATTTIAVTAIPITAVVMYRLPSESRIHWQLMAGGGVMLARAEEGTRTARGTFPAFAISAGPTMSVGLGDLELAAGWTVGFGSVDDQDGGILAAGPIGGFGLTIGYQLAF